MNATSTSTLTRASWELPCQTAPELWFAEREYELVQAQAGCAPCALKDTCLEEALDRGEPAGVWGGQIVVAGEVVARKRGRGRPPRNPRY